MAYRIAVEALDDVRKHARATRVKLRLENRNGGVFGSVHDDGVGFSPDRQAGPVDGYVGLWLMRERAQRAGGWCRVGSIPRNGSTVAFWLPEEDQGS